MISVEIAVSLFLQGLVLGSGPCLMTCAPILLPFIAGTQKSWKEGLFSTLLFSASKAAVYIVLAVVFGYFGALILKVMSSSAGSIIWAAGALFIIYLGIRVIIGGKDLTGNCPKDVKHPEIRSKWNFIALGIFVGLSPCLPLTAALLQVALASDGIFDAAIYGLMFGIGTVISPLVILGSLAGTVPQIMKKNKNALKILNVLSGVLLLATGLYLLIRRF